MSSTLSGHGLEALGSSPFWPSKHDIDGLLQGALPPRDGNLMALFHPFGCCGAASTTDSKGPVALPFRDESDGGALLLIHHLGGPDRVSVAIADGDEATPFSSLERKIRYGGAPEGGGPPWLPLPRLPSRKKYRSCLASAIDQR